MCANVRVQERERERDGPVDQDKHLGAESLVASTLQDRQTHLNLRKCQIGPNDHILYTQHKCPHPSPEADGFLLGDCLKDQETYFAGLCLAQSALRLNPLILNGALENGHPAELTYLSGSRMTLCKWFTESAYCPQQSSRQPAASRSSLQYCTLTTAPPWLIVSSDYIIVSRNFLPYAKALDRERQGGREKEREREERGREGEKERERERERKK
ncbi:hypothetical protein L345_08209, partial [Ophiophagus hannah]